MVFLSFIDFLFWVLKNLMGLARVTVRFGCIEVLRVWYGDIFGSFFYFYFRIFCFFYFGGWFAEEGG